MKNVPLRLAFAVALTSKRGAGWLARVRALSPSARRAAPAYLACAFLFRRARHASAEAQQPIRRPQA